MLVSESLNFMSKRVLRRLKHPVAIGEPGPFTNWHCGLHLCQLASESPNFMPKEWQENF